MAQRQGTRRRQEDKLGFLSYKPGERPRFITSNTSYEETMAVFILADGMGQHGHTAIGDLAEANGKTATVSYLEALRPGTPQELYGAIFGSNTYLNQQYNQHPNLSDLQKISTTITACLLTQVFEKGRKPCYKLYIISVGDSPLLRVRENERSTPEGKVVRRARIDVLTEITPNKGNTSNGIGEGYEQVIIDNNIFTDLKPKDIVLLCSDGVYARNRCKLTLKNLLALLKGDNVQKMAEETTSSAISRTSAEKRLRKSRDNASAIVFRIRR